MARAGPEQRGVHPGTGKGEDHPGPSRHDHGAHRGRPQHRDAGGRSTCAQNVQGSTAGAGSGEFHVYKQSRRREYERLKIMDEAERKVRPLIPPNPSSLRTGR